MTSFPRPRRAFWGDARFLIGIALVALSMTGVWWVLSSSDTASPVLQAARTITRGEPMSASDFRVVEVGLGALSERYLAPQDLESGAVATRTLAEGELVPVGAAATSDDQRTTTLVIESQTGVPTAVAAGSTVELWHAPPLDEGRAHDAPRLLVAEAVVRDVLESEGMLADTASRVEVVVDRADVAEILEAMTGGSLLSVVPIGSGS